MSLLLFPHLSSYSVSSSSAGGGSVISAENKNNTWAYLEHPFFQGRFRSEINETQVQTNTNMQAVVDNVSLERQRNCQSTNHKQLTTLENRPTSNVHESAVLVIMSVWPDDGQSVTDLFTVIPQLLFFFSFRFRAWVVHVFEPPLVLQYDGRVLILHVTVLSLSFFNCSVIQGCLRVSVFLLFPWNNNGGCPNVCACVDLYFIRCGPKTSLETNGLQVGHFVFGLAIVSSDKRMNWVVFCTCTLGEPSGMEVADACSRGTSARL